MKRYKRQFKEARLDSDALLKALLEGPDALSKFMDALVKDSQRSQKDDYYPYAFGRLKGILDSLALDMRYMKVERK